MYIIAFDHVKYALHPCMTDSGLRLNYTSTSNKKGKKGKDMQQNLLGITFRREEDFGNWYSEVVSKA